MILHSQVGAPEKGKFTLDDVRDLYRQYPQIKYTMITGGGPTAHPQLLKKIYVI